jgi:hypothetical protein
MIYFSIFYSSTPEVNISRFPGNNFVRIFPHGFIMLRILYEEYKLFNSCVCSCDYLPNRPNILLSTPFSNSVA